MSQMTAPTEAPTTDEQGVVGQAQELVQEKAQEARGMVSGAVRKQVDERSAQAGTQLGDLTKAFQQTAESLRAEGNDAPAQMLENLTRHTERVGDYLSMSSPENLLGDA